MSEEKKFQSLLDEKRIFNPPKELSEKAYIKTLAQYEDMYNESINDPDKFWSKWAGEIVWEKKWRKTYEFDFVNGRIAWFIGGKLNVTKSCLDRHIKDRGDQVALIFESDDEKSDRKFTYRELYTEVNKFANVLKSQGVKKGDRVSIYLPMIPELAVAMLACARIGAIHSIVFGGFSPDSLADRIVDSKCSFLITSNASMRGGKFIPMKQNADKAMDSAKKRGATVTKCIVVDRKSDKSDVPMVEERDMWWDELMADAGDHCEPEIMDAEDPLFILYTSGSTGKPKGVLHTQGGYIVYVKKTFELIFDYHPGDIYWCTADIGWVTGHSYIVYGPLAAGATTIMFEGIPTYPNPDRFWRVVEKHKVTQFYTAPTAIRAIMGKGDNWPNNCDLSSLKVLGSVGEPINPEAWMWYYNVIGKGRCPIVDTWWQTETGGILITPLPGAIATKPGSATKPFFGVKAKVIRQDGSEAGVNEGGYLVIESAWPGIMRGVYGQPERFKETYFSQYPGYYFTGDGARKDEDGYFWLMGRVDDVINVSGHRMGTAEVESALVSHIAVTEAAVVGYPHEIKGQGIYAYVTLKDGFEASDDLKKELINHVAKEIGPIAKPDVIHFTPALPKTRSGKIMRRILRKIAEGEFQTIGDTTTLADPSVVESLIEWRKKSV
ncbi:MAG: acetate--CoA ligase [Myxococcota bacterium]